METCDTSAVGIFGKGWFWEPGEQLREVQRELLPLFHRATGRRANLLLNVTIDREGKVPASNGGAIAGTERSDRRLNNKVTVE